MTGKVDTVQRNEVGIGDAATISAEQCGAFEN